MEKETQNIEFKASWRDEYLKWICGFANAKEEDCMWAYRTMAKCAVRKKEGFPEP